MDHNAHPTLDHEVPGLRSNLKLFPKLPREVQYMIWDIAAQCNTNQLGSPLFQPFAVKVTISFSVGSDDRHNFHLLCAQGCGDDGKEWDENYEDDMWGCAQD